ncbi:hypothetical protein [Asanoa sp. NPDC050611]|uniref:hypothetical protein n=1 Tax=Asanoa sp. NPDC050611 TaxID=3157098 RepID=UPI0033F6472A
MSGERLPYAACLVIGPALFTAADLFWVGEAEYGLVAGTLLVLGSVAWVVGFAGIAAAIRPYAPRVAGWGMLLASYGAVCGGAAFGLQGVLNAIYGISHDQALAALGDHPVAANVIFWVGGPAFPITLLLLAVYLLASRRVPAWTGILLAAGAVLFPVARIPRIELVALAVDLLLLIPALYLATTIARGDGLPRRGARPVRPRVEQAQDAV